MAVCIVLYLFSVYSFPAADKDTDGIQQGIRSLRIASQFRQAGFLANGSFDSPRLPGVAQWHKAAFVPEYSNGWLAMDFHHLSS